MNKTQKAERLKLKRKQAQLRKMQKAMEAESVLLDELEEEEEFPDPGEEQDDPLAESVTKDMGEESAGVYIGPTSFEELDTIEAAREQAEEVNQVSWRAQDLVYNIIRHPMMNPNEKASAIKSVGDGFEQRVSAILSGDEVEKDMDVLSIEAILAHDARKTGMMEKAMDWIQKKTLSAAGRKKLPAEKFALPGKKKYPIHDKAHVRNALARAAQQIKAGGEGAEDAKAAMPKIRAAAKAFGIEMDMEKEKTGLIVEKDAKGDWRWIGWSTNKFLDFDGEILADAAHKEYTEWLDANPEMSPVFLSWHTPSTARKNAVDFWTYENGFLMMSGALTEEEAAGLLRVQKEIDLGMSHGTIVLERDKANPKVITKYRMFEVSELPLENAANPFTSFETVVKEAEMDKKKYFTDLFGEEKANKYLALTKDAEEKLTEAGVASKESAPEPEKKAESPQATAPLSAQDMESIVKMVGEKYGMDDLNAYLTQAQEAIEKVPLLEELVKSLADNQDEALAEKISPKGGAFIWVNKARASQSAESKLKDGDEADEKLKKSAPSFDPSVDWLAAQTGIAPIPQ